MSEMPDLSKIIGLIMENPELISKIQGLAKSEEDKTAPVAMEKEEVASEKSEPTAAVAANTDAKAQLGAREKRNRLLYAMKPYLSSERAKAIDSMMSIADIVDMIKTR